ncbi:MAG: tetratricopeptide repeat protein [Chloroflexi bacterium]|nr:tetratricopeptide repeat protein [Chloroflexota bacterium]
MSQKKNYTPQKGKKPGTGQEDIIKHLRKKEEKPYSWKGGLPIVICIAVLFIITLGAYLNSFHNDFAFDDRNTIIEDPLIHNPERWPQLLNIWRPLVRLSFLMNYNMGRDSGGGINTLWYHVFNWGFHFANVVLLFLIFRKLLKNRLIFGNLVSKGMSRLSVSPDLLALGAALIFAVHPLQTESVTYITSRSSLMCAFFLFLAFYLYQLSWDSENTNRDLLYLVGIIACFALSISAKPIGVTLPLLMIIYDLLFKGSFSEILEKKWYFYAAVLGLLLVGLLYMVKEGGPTALFSDGVHQVRTYSEHIRGELAVAAIYVRLLFYPVNLNLDYDFPPGGDVKYIPSLWIMLGTAFLLFAVWGAIFSRSRTRPISFALGWFIVNLMVVTIPMVNDFLFEHHLYIILAGFALFIIMLADRLIVFAEENKFEPDLRPVLAGALIVVVGFYVYGTLIRNKDWTSELTIWKDVTQKSPNKYRGWGNLGNSYKERKMYNEAIAAYDRALKLKPDYADAMTSLSAVYIDTNMFPQAEQVLKAAIAANPTQPLTYYNLGLFYAKQNIDDKAEEAYMQCLKYAPEYARAHNNLGNIYMRRNQPEKAREFYEQAIKEQYYFGEAYNNLGSYYGNKGDYNRALEEFNKALTIAKPPYYPSMLNMGLVYARTNQYKAAYDIISKYRGLLIQNEPNSPDIKSIDGFLEDIKKKMPGGQ